MKKWLIGFLTTLLVLLISVYIFIPGIVNLKTDKAVRATGAGMHRMLLDKANMAKWWPGNIKSDSFYFNELVYKIYQGNITLMPVSINGSNTSLITSLLLTSIHTDSIQLQWVGSMATSYSPFKRFSAWIKAKKINGDMDVILQKMVHFYSKPENIYGVEIQKVMIPDTVLIATSGNCKGYPSNEFIYRLIDKLRIYAGSNGAKESGHPILNVSTTDSLNFDVKVAIPLDKMITPSTDIFQKRMPAMRPILVTEITGGLKATAAGLDQIQKYSEDHLLKTAAIPFYSLITDRTKEPDTSKWVTKIYYPVMLYN